jgi:hypothetical protein
VFGTVIILSKCCCASGDRETTGFKFYGRKKEILVCPLQFGAEIVHKHNLLIPRGVFICQ